MKLFMDELCRSKLFLIVIKQSGLCSEQREEKRDLSQPAAKLYGAQALKAAKGVDDFMLDERPPGCTGITHTGMKDTVHIRNRIAAPQHLSTGVVLLTRLHVVLMSD